MTRRAFLVVADWPWQRLSDLGKLTELCTCCGDAHLGIFIPFCTPDEIKAHSYEAVSHESARGARHVTFDYMATLRPAFQSCANSDYYTRDGKVVLYPLLDVDAAELHSLCVEVARSEPYNHLMYRWNAVFPCWPFHCWPSSTPAVAQSTCVALTLRLVAAALVESPDPLSSDAAAFAALGITRCSTTAPCAPATLSGFTPTGGLRALQRAGRVGSAVAGFGEVVDCAAGSLGMGVRPLLALRD